MLDLAAPPIVLLAEGIALLPGRAGPAIVEATCALLKTSVPRTMITPWGKPMSVAMTNCGSLGWVTDRDGYRYVSQDPLTAEPWPAMPAIFRALALEAADTAGFPGFDPQACLVNLYRPGARMGLHRDHDEIDFSQPIVSVSLGMDALFRIGGTKRSDPTRAITVRHGDIVVFGGPARLIFHGIDRVFGAPHPILGELRLNLTFRRVHPMLVNSA